MLGKLNTSEIEEVLHHEVIGRIGCHANDVTYIVPITYAYDGNNIYALSKSGMKVDVMRKNPKVCFEVESFRDMGNWQSVVVWGDFRELQDAEERKDALRKLLNRHMPMVCSETVQLTDHWPFEPADINSIEGIVYTIEVKERSGRFEASSNDHEVSKSFL
jgi:nitroimidazol reductase NimA-like FMN-containing flavoprotein (pyridoxamine 5'-phosphate oxidase superfamily)